MLRTDEYPLPKRASETIAFLFLGLILLPFSTSAQSGAILSFGLPAILVCSLWVILFNRFKISRKYAYIVVLSATYTACVVFFSFFSKEVLASLSRAFIFLLGFLVYVFIVSQTHKLNGRGLSHLLNRLEHHLSISGVLLSIYFMTNFIFKATQFGLNQVLLDRVVGGLSSLPWGASNVVAANLVIPLLVSLNVANRSKILSIERLFPFIILLSIILTLSRTTILVLIIFSIMLFLMNRATLLIYLVITLCIFLIPLIFVDDQNIINSLFGFRINDQINVSQFGGRSTVWEKYLEQISRDPALFVGFYGSLSAFETTPHNILLLSFAEMSIPGILLVLTLFLSNILLGAIAHFRSASRKYEIPYFLIICAIFSILMFEDIIFTHQFMIYFWVLLGISYINFHQRIKNYDAERSADA